MRLPPSTARDASVRRCIPEYLYCYLTSEWFMKKAEKEATGSIFAGIRMAALNAMTIIVPDEKVLKRFSSLIKPIFEQKDKLFNEIPVYLPTDFFFLLNLLYGK